VVIVIQAVVEAAANKGTFLEVEVVGVMMEVAVEVVEMVVVEVVAEEVVVEMVVVVAEEVVEEVVVEVVAEEVVEEEVKKFSGVIYCICHNHQRHYSVGDLPMKIQTE
jgi:hypothetical protein